MPKLALNGTIFAGQPDETVLNILKRKYSNT